MFMHVSDVLGADPLEAGDDVSVIAQHTARGPRAFHIKKRDAGRRDAPKAQEQIADMEKKIAGVEAKCAEMRKKIEELLKEKAENAPAQPSGAGANENEKTEGPEKQEDIKKEAEKTATGVSDAEKAAVARLFRRISGFAMGKEADPLQTDAEGGVEEAEETEPGGDAGTEARKKRRRKQQAAKSKRKK